MGKGKHEKCIYLVHKEKQRILAVIKGNLGGYFFADWLLKRQKLAHFSEFSLISAQSVNSMHALSCALYILYEEKQLTKRLSHCSFVCTGGLYLIIVRQARHSGVYLTL